MDGPISKIKYFLMNGMNFEGAVYPGGPSDSDRWTEMWRFHWVSNNNSAEVTHCTKNSKQISQKWNCAASFPVPTLMYLWGIYIFPSSFLPFSHDRFTYFDGGNL
jgi:hypothetical protein